MPYGNGGMNGKEQIQKNAKSITGDICQNQKFAKTNPLKQKNAGMS